MKHIIWVFITFLYLQTSAQQSAKTVTFTVKGNCEECKENIENAADLKGVKLLTWDQKTKVATVTFNPEKITLSQIQQAIAAKGYDTGDFKGSEKAYKALPKCCKYRDGVCEEKGK
jgi:copper chaperone CopZ